MRDLIPGEWTKTLLAIQALGTPAVIGGGALRDLDNGRPIKDVDVFVPCKTDTDVQVWHAKLSAIFSCDPIDSEAWYPLGEANEVVGFFTFRASGLYPFQFIGVQWDVAKIIDRFDFGICKLSYDGQTVTIHPDYLADKEAKVFRLRRPRDDQQLRASVIRYARLYAKYEGWDFQLYSDGGFADL